jgi:hypothetical protein
MEERVGSGAASAWRREGGGGSYADKGVEAAAGRTLTGCPLLPWVRPNRNNKLFDLFKRISKGSDLSRLKDGLPYSKSFN